MGQGGWAKFFHCDIWVVLKFGLHFPISGGQGCPSKDKLVQEIWVIGPFTSAFCCFALWAMSTIMKPKCDKMVMEQDKWTPTLMPQLHPVQNGFTFYLLPPLNMSVLGVRHYFWLDPYECQCHGTAHPTLCRWGVSYNSDNFWWGRNRNAAIWIWYRVQLQLHIQCNLCQNSKYMYLPFGGEFLITHQLQLLVLPCSSWANVVQNETAFK